VNREPTRLTRQLVVDWARFKFFCLANKWVGLDWLTKWSTRGGSSRIGPDYPFWQL